MFLRSHFKQKVYTMNIYEKYLLVFNTKNKKLQRILNCTPILYGVIKRIFITL